MPNPEGYQLSLDPIRNTEYVRQNTFQVEFDALPPLHVQTAFLPNVNNDPVEVPIGNEKAYVSGKANFDTGELNIRDAVDEQVFQAIINWRKQVYDPATGVISRPSVYKKNGLIRQYIPDGTFIRAWQVLGAWIQAVNWGTLDQGGADIIQIALTIQYDKAIPQ